MSSPIVPVSPSPAVEPSPVPAVPPVVVSSSASDMKSDNMNSLIEQLVQLGFTKRGLNISMLYSNGLDVSKAAEALKKRDEDRKASKAARPTRGAAASAKKPKRSKDNEVSSDDEATKFASQLEELRKQGHVRERRNIRLLREHNGDISVVMNELKDSRSKRAELREALPEWEGALVQLEHDGFTNAKLNIRLLHKYKGHVDAVIARLRDLRHRKANHSKPTKSMEQSAALPLPATSSSASVVIDAKEKKRFSGDKKEKKSKVVDVPAEYVTGNERLVAAGYIKVRKNIRFLSRYHGDVDAVLAKFATKKKKSINNIHQNDAAAAITSAAPAAAVVVPAVDASASSSSTTDEDSDRTSKKTKKEKKEKKRHDRGNGGDAATADDVKVKKEKKEKTCEFDSMEFIGFGSAEFWPANITHIYLDGNNMLYVPDAIRKLALRRHDVHRAEDALGSIAHAFTAAMSHQLKSSVLMYDRPNGRRATSFNASSTPYSMRVLDARPHYTTSDDYLAAIAGDYSIDRALSEMPASPKSVLFVTSDRGLAHRLLATGAFVCKPKHWFKFVAALLDKSSSSEPSPATPAAPAVVSKSGDDVDLHGFTDRFLASLASSRTLSSAPPAAAAT